MLKLDVPSTGLSGGNWPAAASEEAVADCTGWGWPPPKNALSALLDLGISGDQIALYFRVGEECVKRYCERLPFHHGKSDGARQHASCRPLPAARRNKNPEA